MCEQSLDVGVRFIGGNRYISGSQNGDDLAEVLKLLNRQPDHNVLKFGIPRETVDQHQRGGVSLALARRVIREKRVEIGEDAFGPFMPGRDAKREGFSDFLECYCHSGIICSMDPAS